MKNLYIIFFGVALMLTSCDPIVEQKIDIGSAPSANFDFTFIDPNNVTFTNTTSDDHFIVSWDVADVGTFSGDEVEVNFFTAGDYEVTMSVFGRGGSGSITKTVTITQDDPTACDPLVQFLTGCDEKTWKLNPAEGALWVGPTDNSQTWWQSSAGDVTLRDCDWNDEYKFNKDGTYTYVSNGDLWGESYMGFGSDQCYPITDLPADRADWGDGVHTIEIIPAAGSSPDQIKVSGSGAFLGIRKAANGMEVTHPQASVTYDIVDTRTEAGKDILEIEVNFGGGIWRFTLASE
jgi:PKD repeat protein